MYNSQDASFNYINAGHNPPVLLRKDGTIIELKKGGVFIGYVPWEYESETITLKSGDVLVLYTDGLVEAMNEKEEEFRMESLIAIMKQNSHLKSKDLEVKIIDAVIKHTGNISLDDDFTLLTVKYKT